MTLLDCSSFRCFPRFPHSFCVQQGAGEAPPLGQTESSCSWQTVSPAIARCCTDKTIAGCRLCVTSMCADYISNAPDNLNQRIARLRKDIPTHARDKAGMKKTSSVWHSSRSPREVNMTTHATGFIDRHWSMYGTQPALAKG